MPGSPAPPPATSRAPPVPRPGPRGAGGRGRTHGQVQLDGVHGLVEGPGELVLPQRLDHHVLHVLQLVGLAAGLGGVGHLGRGRVHGARGPRQPRGGGRRRGGHRPEACSRAGAAAAQGGPRVLPISRPDRAAPGEKGHRGSGHRGPAPAPMAEPPALGQPAHLPQNHRTHAGHRETVAKGRLSTRPPGRGGAGVGRRLPSRGGQAAGSAHCPPRADSTRSGRRSSRP